MQEQNAVTTSAPNAGALVQIAAMNADLDVVQSVIKENLGAGGMSEFDLQRIKMPSGESPFYTVSDMDGESAQKTIRVIILLARDVRGYWKGSIDDTGGGTPPDCHSNDARTGIGDPGGDCATCALNLFGSAAKGDGKACKEVKQLFILRAGSGSVLPEVFAVPPTSLKAVRKYGLMLGGRGVPLSGVVTEIGLEPGKSTGGQKYNKATFRPAGLLSAEEREKVKNIAELYRPLIQSAVTVRADDVSGQAERDPAFD